MEYETGSVESVEIVASFWLDRPTLVTGATGFLGSWLVPRLANQGADIVCLVRDWIPQSELVRAKWIERTRVVRGDVREQALMERILGEYEIDTVFHLAAQTIVGIANRNPVSTLETNIRGTWVLLEAARRSPNVKQIVLASSDKAYGDSNQVPYTEGLPVAGRHPYDASKSCADLLAQMYSATYELPIAITRCGNFYGGGDLNWNRIVPGTIRSVMRGQRPIIRSDGNCVRDYFYVEDAAAAYMLLAEQMSFRPDLRGQAFNFSNETQTTTTELAHHILKLMNSDLQPEIRDEVTNEIARQYLSAEKARRILGWKSLFSLEEGLKTTIEWYREFFLDAH